jgi:hypothetical protein
MRYMMLYKPGYESDAPPTEAEMAQMGHFIGELAASGVLLATDGLAPSAMGSRVRLENGEFSVTDGPFAETKELIAGFAIVQVESREQALDLARRFLNVVGGGESEIRLMHDVAAYPPDVSVAQSA